MDSQDWVQVKPRKEHKPSRALHQNASSPRSPKGRTASFGEVLEVPLKAQISKSAHRELKLEWSASKTRARDAKIAKRNLQRSASKPGTPEEEED